MTRRECFQRLGASGLGLILAGGMPWPAGCTRERPMVRENVIIGVSPSLTACLEYIAQARGFFSEQGLTVEIRTYSSGVAGIVEMLGGAIHAASSTAIPVVMQSFVRSDFRVVAVLATMANDNWLVARKDAGISSVRDLAGKRIGCLKGGMPQFVLDLLLMRHGMTNRDIVASFAPPQHLVEALIDKRLDGVVLFGKYVDQIRGHLGDSAMCFGDKLLAELTSYLTVREELVRTNPGLIERLLRAYLQADRFAAEHPEEAMAIASRGLSMDLAKVRESWQDCNFHVGLQQHLLSDLEDKAVWATSRGIAPSPQIPNFLPLFDYHALEHIAPSRVTLIHTAP